MSNILFFAVFFLLYGAVMSQFRRNLRPFGRHGNFHEGQEISVGRRKWAVRINPEYQDGYSSPEEMAKSIADGFGLDGKSIGNLHGWFVFSERKDSEPITDDKVKELSDDERLEEVRLEVPHLVVPKLKMK